MRLSRFNGGVYLVLGPVFHKSLETGFQFGKNDGISIRGRFSTRGDHAGLVFSLEFFGFLYEFNLIDTRHWDYDADCWQVYPEDEE